MRRVLPWLICSMSAITVGACGGASTIGHVVDYAPQVYRDPSGWSVTTPSGWHVVRFHDFVPGIASAGVQISNVRLPPPAINPQGREDRSSSTCRACLDHSLSSFEHTPTIRRLYGNSRAGSYPPAAGLGSEVPATGVEACRSGAGVRWPHRRGGCAARPLRQRSGVRRRRRTVLKSQRRRVASASHRGGLQHASHQLDAFTNHRRRARSARVAAHLPVEIASLRYSRGVAPFWTTLERFRS